MTDPNVGPVPDVGGAPVTVGVDGSKASMRAVEWAAQAAVERGMQLLIVHACGQNCLPAVHLAIGRHCRCAAEAVSVARAQAAGVAILVRVVKAPAGAALVERSIASALIVVGRSGGGEFSECGLGATTTRLIAESCCPVVLVPELETRVVDGGPGVVLAVESGHVEDLAFDLALTEAIRRDVALTVLPLESATPVPGDIGGISLPGVPVSGHPERGSSLTLRTSRRPVVPSESAGHPPKDVVALSEGAALIVVALPRRIPGGDRGPAVRELARTAPCPLMITV